MLRAALEQGLVYGILAIGVYLTFRVLDFPDLTVDGSFPLGGAVAATLIVAGWNPFLATALAAVFGYVAGITTGVLNTKLRISGLLSGILTMTALYSINLRIMGRSNVPLLRQDTVLTLIEGLGIPEPVRALVLFFVVVAVFVLVVSAFLHTEFGLALRATGDNERMIRSLGVDTDTMKIVGLGISNALVAFSGALVAQFQGFTDVGMGIGMVVAGLASVIIGEVVVPPRTVVRAVTGAVAGSVVYRLVIAFALRAGFAPTDLKLVTAAMVVIALAAPGTTFAPLVKRYLGLGSGRAAIAGVAGSGEEPGKRAGANQEAR
ncbi:MAG TPA: ABC transporter permease [Firmicutes bacterium]|nr:ABC transporter permease [Bacillota bacterium]